MASDEKPLGIVKKIIIEVDVVNNVMTFDNPDELSYLEILGIIEYAKMSIMETRMKGE